MVVLNFNKKPVLNAYKSMMTVKELAEQETSNILRNYLK